jgi:hypothetical protein
MTTGKERSTTRLARRAASVAPRTPSQKIVSAMLAEATSRMTVQQRRLAKSDPDGLLSRVTLAVESAGNFAKAAFDMARQGHIPKAQDDVEYLFKMYDQVVAMRRRAEVATAPAAAGSRAA